MVVLHLASGLYRVASMAQGLKVRPCPWVTALFDGLDVVHISSYLSAFAERMVEQD